jgi:hypothetical protein
VLTVDRRELQIEAKFLLRGFVGRKNPVRTARADVGICKNKVRMCRCKRVSYYGPWTIDDGLSY